MPPRAGLDRQKWIRGYVYNDSVYEKQVHLFYLWLHEIIGRVILIAGDPARIAKWESGVALDDEGSTINLFNILFRRSPNHLG